MSKTGYWQGAGRQHKKAPGLYRAVGLMSGTSLDGVDVAIIETDGKTIIEFGTTHFRPYLDEEKDVLNRATQAALNWNFLGPPPTIFKQAEDIVHMANIEAVRGIGASSVDLIGFHGQTVLHRPPANGQYGKTLQLGNGRVLADALGLDVVYDFRSTDMGAGGQGAPLAPAYHGALLKKSNIDLPAAVLNIGGVSNVSIMSATGELYATDCGPGNGPLDSWVKKIGIGDYDKDGVLSLAGTPDLKRIAGWLEKDFFTKPVPKSADRWDFDVLDDLKNLSEADAAATLAAFCAASIKQTLALYGYEMKSIIVCGGGRKNPAIMKALRAQNDATVLAAEQIEWLGDHIEAQAFAYLAVRSVQGLPLTFPNTTGTQSPTSGGKLITG